MMKWITLSVILMVWQMNKTEGHIEDICVAPPDPTSNVSGIYNFYTLASRMGCDYSQTNLSCIAAALEDVGKAQSTNTPCRGAMHFNSIYFMAVALGFKRDIAYSLASFSQAIDYVQYQGVNSCGQNMSKAYWTPPVRAFQRTDVRNGGSNLHLGIPFVGFLKQSPLSPNATNGQGLQLNQSMKTYTGGSHGGCKSYNFDLTHDEYLHNCPGLRPNVTDLFYDGALAHGRRWAFGQTDLLCTGGFTTIDPTTGSPFLGDKCLDNVTQLNVNIVPNTILEGSLNNALTGGNLVTGEHIINYDCVPNCSVANYVATNVTYASEWDQYLVDQARTNGYALLQDPSGPVPSYVARFGIYLHWLADRASHWYCTDTSASGVVGVRNTSFPDQYSLYWYLDYENCNFLSHMMTHYWEQGVSELSPATYTALSKSFQEMSIFRQQFLTIHPEWFRRGASTLSFDRIIGTYQKPGILFNLALIKDAEKRVKQEIDILRALNLPPIPGFEHLCA